MAPHAPCRPQRATRSERAVYRGWAAWYTFGAATNLLEDLDQAAFRRFELTVRFDPRRTGAPLDPLGYCPAGGCQSSTLLPSGSNTQPNFPYSESSVFSSTWQPSSRRAWSRAARSSTR